MGGWCGQQCAPVPFKSWSVDRSRAQHRPSCGQREAKSPSNIASVKFLKSIEMNPHCIRILDRIRAMSDGINIVTHLRNESLHKNRFSELRRFMYKDRCTGMYLIVKKQRAISSCHDVSSMLS